MGFYLTSSLNFDHYILLFPLVKHSKFLDLLHGIRNRFVPLSVFVHYILLQFVPCILENGLVVWHPYLTKDQLKLNARFLSHTAFIHVIEPPHHDYSPIKRVWNIPTHLLRRREVKNPFRFLPSRGLSIDVTDFRVPTYFPQKSCSIYCSLSHVLYNT